MYTNVPDLPNCGYVKEWPSKLIHTELFRGKKVLSNASKYTHTHKYTLWHTEREGETEGLIKQMEKNINNRWIWVKAIIKVLYVTLTTVLTVWN